MLRRARASRSVCRARTRRDAAWGCARGARHAPLYHGGGLAGDRATAAALAAGGQALDRRGRPASSAAVDAARGRRGGGAIAIRCTRVASRATASRRRNRARAVDDEPIVLRAAMLGEVEDRRLVAAA